MTTKDITMKLIGDLYRRSFVVPNYTPSQWWECDVFEVTKAGYFREYEIKLTRSDFVADRTKCRTDWKKVDGQWGRVAGETKHQLLEREPTCGPVQFFFVTPAGLLRPEELPPWAGLIEVTRVPWQSGAYLLTDQIKAAPRLHRQKIAPAVVEHARSICYWRFHNIYRERYNAQKKSVDKPSALA